MIFFYTLGSVYNIPTRGLYKNTKEPAFSVAAGTLTVNRASSIDVAPNFSI